MSLKTENMILCELFGIPADATAATIRLRAGEAPTIVISRLALNDLGKNPEAKKYRFQLIQVPDPAAPKETHDYPACAIFRGGKCTCDQGDVNGNQALPLP